MSQVGYTPISLYYSSTAGNTPTAGNLVAGELAINTADGKLFYKDSAGVVQVIAGKGGAGVAGGSNTQVQYNSSGSLAGSANFTFNGTTVTIANDASISGLTVGKGGGSVSTNTALGASALSANTTGSYSVAVGNGALAGVHTSQYNTAVGNAALNATTSGGDNTGVGNGALYTNTTGADNTAVGHWALLSNSTGASNNTAIGSQALKSNTTASNNTAVGYQSLYNNTTAQSNTAVGTGSLYTNTTGGANTAVGRDALGLNTTASNNSAFGRSALAANTTGANNSAFGQESLASNTTASNNTAVGYQALYTGSTFAGIGAVTAIGHSAGYTNNSYSGVFVGQNAGLNSTGYGNTMVGQGAGNAVTTGAANTILGRYSGNQGGLDIRTSSNYIVLSDGDGNPRLSYDSATWNVPAYASNQLVTSGIGSRQYSMTVRSQSTGGIYVENNDWGGATGIQINTLGTGTSDIRNIRFYRAGTLVGDITSTNTSTAYNSGSDYRLKENIAPMTGALDKVAQLKPCTFKWKIDGSDGQGFIAHELQAVIPDAVTGEKDAVDEDGKPHYQGVDTSFLVATLTAAIQELKAEVDSLKSQLAK